MCPFSISIFKVESLEGVLFSGVCSNGIKSGYAKDYREEDSAKSHMEMALSSCT
ncbi:hypothetical protein VHA01S_005_01560 [Vibrio halioticoli NBRC 102217]|uniref:Uncharacterized protein n=1 Tax=Vibrio halioticoli NBRC 102217 TaxID=1219072 RepID=V5FHR1_9VIBR|nr:hypothetical protein VHA01S_005_01560 [Vibrio halioticoli NBRC 102217]